MPMSPFETGPGARTIYETNVEYTKDQHITDLQARNTELVEINRQLEARIEIVITNIDPCSIVVSCAYCGRSDIDFSFNRGVISFRCRECGIARAIDLPIKSPGMS
jgi:hypothetical protein